VLADEDARNVTFKYDLSILPIFMKFDSHDELQFPVANIDRDKLAAWIDDRIISFVRTYLELHQNNYYLQEHLVEDPVAKVRFPKYAAGAKLDSKGKTVYFISEETRRQYEKQQG
jgi:YHS domain-containing protein